MTVWEERDKEHRKAIRTVGNHKRYYIGDLSCYIKKEHFEKDSYTIIIIYISAVNLVPKVILGLIVDMTHQSTLNICWAYNWNYYCSLSVCLKTLTSITYNSMQDIADRSYGLRSPSCFLIIQSSLSLSKWNIVWDET